MLMDSNKKVSTLDIFQLKLGHYLIVYVNKCKKIKILDHKRLGFGNIKRLFLIPTLYDVRGNRGNIKLFPPMMKAR